MRNDTMQDDTINVLSTAIYILHQCTCDRVPGGVVRVQRTRACNGHWCRVAHYYH